MLAAESGDGDVRLFDEECEGSHLGEEQVVFGCAGVGVDDLVDACLHVGGDEPAVFEEDGQGTADACGGGGVFVADRVGVLHGRAEPVDAQVDGLLVRVADAGRGCDVHVGPHMHSRATVHVWRVSLALILVIVGAVAALAGIALAVLSEVGHVRASFALGTAGVGALIVGAFACVACVVLAVVV